MLLATLNLYVRIFFVTVWMLLCCSAATLLSLFSWGNPRQFQWSANVMSEGIFKLLGLKYELRGREHVTGTFPAIFVVNHQSALDIAFGGAICPPRCVPLGKKELGWIPIIGWWFVGTGGRLVDRGDHEKAMKRLGEIERSLREKELSLAIAPEGTRNRSGVGLLPFKKGAFRLAIATGTPIVPVVIAPYLHVASWSARRLKRATIPIEALAPIPTKGMGVEDLDRLIETTRTQIESALTRLTVSVEAGVVS